MTNPHPLREHRLSRLGRDPLETLEQNQARQLGLCDILEQIADSLPADMDHSRCQQAASALRHDLPLHHQDEEHGLFPLLRRHAPQSERLAAIMAQLSSEHATDQGFAEELGEQLESLARGHSPSNPESIMPAYGFLETTDLNMKDAGAHLKANQWVGVPYSDDQIANAQADLVAQASVDGAEAMLARYPKAQARDYDGHPGRVTEMDALIAYLQMLGTLVDFSAYQAEANVR